MGGRGSSGKRKNSAASGKKKETTSLGRLETVGGERLTRSESRAVAEYQNEAYRNVNRILRGQDIVGSGSKERIRKESQEIIAGVDAAFRKASVLKYTTQVLRGVNPSNVADILSSKNPIGRVFTEKGYVSTTTRKGGYYLDRNVVMEISVPKGTKVLQPRGGNRREREVLLNRGTRMKVTGIKKEKSPFTGETRTILQMRVIK